MKHIFVDFNTLNSESVERLKLGQEGTPNGDALPSLQPGERVVFYDGELEVEGTVEAVIVRGCRFWLGVPDWATQRDMASV